MSESLRVLIVDDDRRMAQTLVDILRVKGYEAEGVHSASEALEVISTRTFDCVLSDIKMPGTNGVELFKAIKAQQPEFPVVLMTAYSTDQLVQEGLEEGAIAVISKPIDIHQILAFFSTLEKESAITIVDDDPHFCRTLGDILSARGFVVTQMNDPSGLVEHLSINGQTVMLDMKLQDTDGLEVLQRIRQQYPHQPVILVTGYRQEMMSSIERALEISAYTCLYKPLDIDSLLQVLGEIHRGVLGRLLGQPIRKRV
jgi:two-component system response regulator HydG